MVPQEGTSARGGNAGSAEDHPQSKLGYRRVVKWSTPTYEYKGNIFTFNPAKGFVSLLFHTGAKLPGEFAGLEGEGDTARVMRFADLADVKARSGELTAVMKAWCDWKDGKL